MSTIINPFAPADLEQEAFVWFEQAITDKDLANKTATLRLFNIWAAVSSMEVTVESMDEAPVSWEIGDWTKMSPLDTLGLPITPDLAGKITNYTMLKIDDELVVVKSVNRDLNEIDVYQRGQGWTTATQHVAWTVALITGYNYVVWQKDIESRIEGENTSTYYVAKNTVPAVSFTKEDLVIKRKYYGENGQMDYVNSKIDNMDKHLLVTQNKNMIYSWGQKGTATTPASLVWIIQEATTKGNIFTNFGAIDTVEKLNGALTVSRNKWGSADVIICGPSSYDDIQKLANLSSVSMQTPNRLELVLGASVKALVTKVGTLIPVLDISFPDDKVLICNSNDLYWAPLTWFETPGADRTIATESTRNDQAFTVDSITQWATYYFNSNKNMTIITWVTH